MPLRGRFISGIIILLFSLEVMAKPYKIIVLSPKVWSDKEIFVQKVKPDKDIKTLLVLQKMIYKRLNQVYGVRASSLFNGIERTSPDKKELLIRGFLELGIELYRELKIKEAVKILNRALVMAQKTQSVWKYPYLLARVYLYLGLSQMELNNKDQAILFFRYMFELKPHTEFLKGYFPARVEDAMRVGYLNARASAMDTVYCSKCSVQQIQRAANVDAIIWLLRPFGTKSIVKLIIYDRNLPQKFFIRKLLLKDLSMTKELLNAALNAYIACLPLDYKKKKRFGDMHNLFMETGAQYLIYSRYPTRKPFHNLGVNFALDYRIRSNLMMSLFFDLATSIGDPYDDLIKGFSTYMAGLGPVYLFSWKWGMVYAGPLLNITYVSPYTITTNPNCKFFGKDGPGCNKNSLKRRGPSVLLGFSSRMGTKIHIFKGLYAMSELRFTAFFSELTMSQNYIMWELNFPFSVILGFSYGF